MAEDPPIVRRYLDALAPGSRRAMRQALARAEAAWRDELGVVETAWADLTARDAGAIRDRLARELKPATLNKVLSALRGLARHARAAGVMSADQARAIEAIPQVAPAVSEMPPRVLTHTEAVRLFERLRADPSPASRRDGALLALLLTTGMRRAEIAALVIQDFDPGKATLRVTADDASRPERTLTLPRWAVRWVQAWRCVPTSQGGREEPLFRPVNKAGRVLPRAMTDQAVYDAVRRAGRRAGVPDLTSRGLRRTCAVEMMTRGASLEAVQARLGHASWLTTAAYRELAASAGRGAVDFRRLPPPAAASQPPEEPRRGRHR